MILRYVKMKEEWWKKKDKYKSERISSGDKVEKKVCKKKLGRINRIYMKDEKESKNN
jgi:hypothetical protein